MITVKLTKKMLNLHPLDLLIELGAISNGKKRVYPGNVYFSKEDSKKLKVNLKKLAKRTAPHSNKRLINYAVKLDWLNYGPNNGLSRVIKPGWAIIDVDAIKRDKE